MHANNKVCPNCRNPINGKVCRLCGYQQKILKVVDSQEFGRVNIQGHIRDRENRKENIELSRKEKLQIYLKQYQNLLKSCVIKITQDQSFSRQQTKRLEEEVKFIWQKILLKKVRGGGCISETLQKAIRWRGRGKQQKKGNKEQPINEEKDEQQSKEEPETQMKKKLKSTQKVITAQTQFRSFYLVSVKQLINQSIEECKSNPRALSSAQRRFLSYLLELKEIKQDFITITIKKYINLLLKLKRSNQQKYIKQGFIKSELQIRGFEMKDNKQHSMMYLLLIDLFRCWGRDQEISIIIAQYQNSQSNIDFIDKLSNYLNENSKQIDKNPKLNYCLIYSIIYIAATRIKECLTIGEILAIIGRIQIGRVKVEMKDEELFLPSIPNEESITPFKIRKTSHNLSAYLDLQFQHCRSRWIYKWCSKFDLLIHQKQIDLLHSILLHEHRFSKKENPFGFRNFTELEQDIASLSAIYIYLKLSNGLSSYPYLINFPFQIEQNYEIKDKAVFKQIEELVKLGKMKVKQKQQIVEKCIPSYITQLNILKLTSKLSHINRRDKYLSEACISNQTIRVCNNSHISLVSSSRLHSLFENDQPQKIINLKYEDLLFMQKNRSKNQKFQRPKNRMPKRQLTKQQATFHHYLVKQVEHIISSEGGEMQDQLAAQTEYEIDHPSSNYELLYEYTGENLELCERNEQIYLLELLCLNSTTFSELTSWVSKYQNILKQFERE